MTQPEDQETIDLREQVTRLSKRAAADHRGFIDSRRSIITQRDAALARLAAVERERDNLAKQLGEHDEVRADLMRQQEARRLAEWQDADRQIRALEAERLRVTALGAQWAQEREDARERLGRALATLDDMVVDVARVEGERDAALARLAAVEARIRDEEAL